MTTSRRPAPLAMVVASVLASLLASAWPLLVYSLSLASFGLLHVLVELRYVDRRFGHRFTPAFWTLCAAPIGGVVLLRGLRMAGVVGEVGTPAELVLVAATMGGGLWAVSRGGGVHGRGPLLVAGLGAVALLIGAVLAPLPTLLVLAVAHNATPLGFLVERSAHRGRALLGYGAVFVGVPLLTAILVSPALLRALGPAAADISVFATGPLADHLGVYVLPAFVRADIAQHLFAAAVCAQLLHYAAVIVWLPRTLGDDETARVSGVWSRHQRLVVVAVVAVVAVGLLVHFAVDFRGARGLYGLPAAVHAWLELPVIAAGLATAGATRASSNAATTTAGPAQTT